MKRFLCLTYKDKAAIFHPILLCVISKLSLAKFLNYYLFYHRHTCIRYYLYFKYMYKYCVSYFLSCSVWWLNLLLKVKCSPYRKLLFTCIYFIRNYWTNDRYFTVNDVIINSFYKYLIWATIKIMCFECYFQ